MNSERFAKRNALSGSLLLGALLLISARPGPTSCTEAKTRSFEYSICELGSVWIIETSQPLRPFFSKNRVPTLRVRAGKSHEFAALLNGAYHDGNYAKPTMEGLLFIEGEQISPAKIGDLQLTHFLVLDDGGKIAGIQHASMLPANYPLSGHSYTQSGPLITDRGVPTPDYIERSLNGSDAYKRTAIGMTAAGDTVIVIAKTPRTLSELGEIVLNTRNYRRRGLTLLNFDGGPSTAFHASGATELSYGADKVTPVGFRIEN